MVVVKLSLHKLRALTFTPHIYKQIDHLCSLMMSSAAQLCVYSLCVLCVGVEILLLLWFLAA